jgi:hypothetical protein
MHSARFSFQVLMKLDFSRKNFEKYSNVNFRKSKSSGSGLVPCGRTGRRTDMTKLIVAFGNFVKVLDNES